MLLNPNNEMSTVVISLEKESETKEVEDVNVYVFNKTPLRDVNPFVRNQSLLFVFYNKTLNEIHLETSSPPPDYI